MCDRTPAHPPADGGCRGLSKPAPIGQEQNALMQRSDSAERTRMIAKLKGLLDETGADWAVIDVAGVGYLVHCSSKTLGALGETGEACTVYTDLQVSENDMRLLGFASGTERDWFRLLTQVQGVGSKVALAILSALSPDELQRACAAQDAASVARANGVGPKLASRIVNELKDKAGGIASSGGLGITASPAASGSASAWARSMVRVAITMRPMPWLCRWRAASSIVSPAPINNAVLRLKSPKICLARLTAANATDTGLAPIAVSVRTCLATEKAC